MSDKNQINIHHRQEAKEEQKHQPPTNPTLKKTFFPIPKTTGKKFLILFTLLLGLTLGGLLIFFLIKPHLLKDQPEKNLSAEIITDNDWKNIKDKIAESYL